MKLRFQGQSLLSQRARKAAALAALKKDAQAETAWAQAQALGYVRTAPLSPFWQNLQRHVLFLVRLFMIFCVLAYPVWPGSFKACLCASLVVFLAQLYVQHGFPKLNEEYAKVIMYDYRLHYAIVAITFLVSSPFILGLLPLVFSEFGHVAEYLDTKLRQLLPSFVRFLDWLVSKSVPIFTGISEGEWGNTCTSGKWELFNIR